MKMEKKPVHWVFITIVLMLDAVIVAAVYLPPLPRPKARMQHVQPVNSVRSVFITLPATNAPPSGC